MAAGLRLPGAATGVWSASSPLVVAKGALQLWKQSGIWVNALRPATIVIPSQEGSGAGGSAIEVKVYLEDEEDLLDIMSIVIHALQLAGNRHEPQ